MSKHAALGECRPYIHAAGRPDAAAIARIYVDSWNVGFRGFFPERQLTAELIERWGRDLAEPIPHRWWIAEVDQRPVGFAGIRPSRDPVDPAIGELDTIAVDPAWWRRGIGRALLSVALDQQRADGYREAVLWTLAHYEQGQRFYQAAGWTADGGTRDAGRQVRFRHRLAPQLERQ
jgi:GNAT superfamily N-acetyltransferase